MKLDKKNIGYISLIAIFILINIFLIWEIIKNGESDSQALSNNSLPANTATQVVGMALLGTPAQIGTLSLIGTPNLENSEASTPPPPFTETPRLPTFTPQGSPTPSLTSTAKIKVAGYDCIPADTKRESARVEYVIDGNTIEVTLNGKTEIVRYIGIDTPQLNERFYQDSVEANEEMVEDEIVTLVTDVTDKNQQGQLLRYVFIGESFFVNYELVKEGMGLASTIPPDTSCAAYFLDAQRIATNKEVGIWDPKPKATSTPKP